MNSRFGFILIFALSSLLFNCSTSRMEPDSPPNILLVICDDLNDSVQGMGGHPQALTPNMDRFAKSAVRFSNAHSNSPLCGPSRASLWTGLYPHTTGYYGRDQNDNHWRNNPVMKNTVTLFEHFERSGYRLYGTGKIFHNNQATKQLFDRPDRSNGFGQPMSYGPYPWDGKSDWPWLLRHPSMPQPWGVNVFETFAPLSDVPVVEPDPAKGTPGFSGWWDKGGPFHYSDREDRDQMPDELSAEWAISQLEEHGSGPFFMTVGFVRPHSPWIVPEEYFDLFPLDEVELPPYLEDDLLDVPNIFLETKYSESNGQGDKMTRLRDAYEGEEGWKRWIQGYLASVAFVDAQFGRVLTALEKSSHRENTIVILTSDHGYHMGEKDWLFKLTTWEESTRVPLVLRPARSKTAASAIDHPVSLVDLYPTLIDLCGLSPDPNSGGNTLPLDGHSLRSFLGISETQAWRGPEVALSCIYGEYPVGRDEAGKVEEQHFTVRSRDWRYVLCNNGEEELYDHRSDPHEWQNLAKEDAYKSTKARLKTQLQELIK